MKATCTKNEKHKKFVTTAHVMEEWVVDEYGEFLDTNGSLETTHGPDPENNWTCAICGADAKVEG